ncbi:MAG TPA: NADPH:quinone oxidoreductase family protein [Burkholderiaceae bacterium]|nr:NADPH:quinone oxidoreductase family protein [Burkholderiaceae bacterium]
MKAIRCTRFDEEPALAIGEMPDLQPKAEEVLVEPHAAAASFMDLLMAQGKYQMRPQLPYVPGTDAAGIVVAVGDKVTRFRAGDRVACGYWHGAWAEQMMVPEAHVTPVPGGVDFATAASLRYAYGTARYALVESAHLRAGETLFVSGAAGGVGLAAVDLGRHLGARVIAGVGSRSKEATVRERGASEVVVYGEEDLRERIKSLTGARGVDVCMDNVGGSVFDAMTRSMNWGGRLLPIGFTSGNIPSVAANLPLLKNYSIVGAYWGAWAARCPAESAAADEAVMRLVAAGELRPLVSRVLPWTQFGEALDAIKRREVQGRIVLAMPPTLR